MEIRNKVSLNKIKSHEDIKRDVKEKQNANINKMAQANSLGALASFGKAQVSLTFKGICQSYKNLVLNLINETAGNYEENLDCDEKRKKEFLLNLEDKRRSVRFCDNYEEEYQKMIKSYLYKAYTDDNMALLKELFNIKTKDNKYRFSGDDVFCIAENVTVFNKDILNRLLYSKDKDGNFRFNCNNITNILNQITPDNKDKISLLIESKNPKDDYRFNCKDITNILNKLTSDNKDLLDILVKAEDINGNCRFNSQDIAQILSQINPGNKDIVHFLLESKDLNGNYKFDTNKIEEILSKTTSENKNSIKILINEKAQNGEFRFDWNNTAHILPHLTPEKQEVFNTLIKAKNNEDNFRFDGYEIADILSLVTDKNKDLFCDLLNMKTKEGNYRFKAEDISVILKKTAPENKDFCEFIINAQNDDNSFSYNFSYISYLLDMVSQNNKDDIITLIQIKDSEENYRYNADNLSNILYRTKPENREVVFELAKAKDKKGNFRFDETALAKILYALEPDNKDFLLRLLRAEDDNTKFEYCEKDIIELLKRVNMENSKFLNTLIPPLLKDEISVNYIIALLNTEYNITLEDIKTVEQIIGSDALRSFTENEICIAAAFKDLINKHSISEIPISKKKDIVRKLVAANTDLFEASNKIKQYIPLIPSSQEEYCSLLPALIKSVDIKIKPLDEAKTTKIIEYCISLAEELEKITDEAYTKLSVNQEYSTEAFVKDVWDTVKYLPTEERQKVFDYYDFEIYKIKGANGYNLKGYPINRNNDKKLAQIRDFQALEAIEKLRPYVIKYSENNGITSDNPKIEKLLNEIISIFPELRTEISKKQHTTHDYDLFKHSLKVVQKIVQQPEFEDLNDSDKKIMILAGLFHDITKPKDISDPTHPYESAFDTYFILKKLNLTQDEQIKLYSLIKNHEWFAFVNTDNMPESEFLERIHSVAFEMQYDNLFELAKILTIADLKGVKQDDAYYINYKNDFENRIQEISKLIGDLKKTQPLLPITPIPRASTIASAITVVNADGSTNLKGVYKDKSGLIILKFNEIENDTWGKIGFPKGSVSHGIKSKGVSILRNKILPEYDIDTGNIKFFAHGLEFPNQLYKFDAFALPDSDALISVSYTERPESKYRFYKKQGVLLTTDAKYVLGGGNTDSGSGFKKEISTFTSNYVFGGEREADRNFISDLIKSVLNLSEEEYIKFIKENSNKPFTEIEPKEVRELIIKAFASIKSHIREDNREYNEMYITNPKVMGVFAYSENEKTGDVMDFISQQQDFLKQFALDNDLPFVIFGD